MIMNRQEIRKPVPFLYFKRMTEFVWLFLKHTKNALTFTSLIMQLLFK